MNKARQTTLGLRRRPLHKHPSTTAIATHPRPKVSIVVPVFNVEAYVAECLDSLVGQTLQDIEIVIVDDCSPDGSMDIVDAYADNDPRIKIVRLSENVGLSAARNAGIRQAHGTYLCFVDSDDILQPTACATASNTLDETGSDFAIFGYERFNSSRTWAAASWITKVHKRTQTKITAAAYPDVLANAMACSKVFRREFWDKLEIEFPVGVTYEDQPVSAKAFALAGSIDIIGQVLLRWRARDDGTSITQQAATHQNLTHQFNAVEASLQIFEQSGNPKLAQKRLSQFLINDFTYCVPGVPQASEQFWDVLVLGLRALFDRANFADWIWDALPPQTRVTYELVLRGDRANMVKFYDLEGRNAKFFPTEIVSGKVLLKLPFFEDPSVNIAPERFELLPRQRRLVTATRRVWWMDDSTLAVEGWAYIDNIDHDRYPVTITAILINQATGSAIPWVPCKLVPRRDQEVSRVSQNRWANHEGSAFRIEIPVEELLLADDKASSWSLRLHASAGGIQASGALKHFLRHGSAGRLAPKYFKNGTRATAHFSQSGDLGIQFQRPALNLVDFSHHGLATSLSFTARTTGWTKLHISHRGESVDVPLRADADGVFHAAFTMPPADPGANNDNRMTAPVVEKQMWPWVIRAVKKNGKTAAIAWPDSGPAPSWIEPTAPRLFKTAAGNVGTDEATATIEIALAEVEADELRLTLNVDGQNLSDATIELAGSKAKIQVPVNLTIGVNVVTLPLQASIWGGKVLPLPLGRYELSVRTPSERIKVEIHRLLLDQLPMQVLSTRLHARIEPSYHNQFVLMVIKPLALSERGARQQRELQDWHAELTPEPELGVALFRSYFGENTACNAGAAHAEIRKQNKDITVYWAVTDYSVPVPDGGIPVIHESEDWYRLLRNAEYIMDNMHQPIYHVKAPHQKVIVTFHGYPFKVMGHSHWENLLLSQSRIDAFDRRASQWDYLVSPARYATPLLRRDFRYGGKVLEIGYPRNDVLVAENRDDVRQSTREILGIEDHQTAVLYAPTFRDYLSANDFSAPLPDLINLHELTASLGPDYVILVRGHAFNARAEARFDGDHIIDVTLYPDVADLYLAADVAIVDYSSLRFDFAITKKPMLFLVPDIERYVEGRGWLFDFGPTAPGPFVNNASETIVALRNLEQVKAEYAIVYAKFLEEYVDLEDGHASERLVSAVFS